MAWRGERSNDRLAMMKRPPYLPGARRLRRAGQLQRVAVPMMLAGAVLYCFEDGGWLRFVWPVLWFGGAFVLALAIDQHERGKAGYD